MSSSDASYCRLPQVLPTLRLDSPANWLMLGWRDLWANPVPGLLHGAALCAFGWLLFVLARDRFWFLAGAFSGFLIVAPVLATGLYEISRQAAQGRRATLVDVWRVWTSFDGRLMRFGLLLGLAGTGWVMTSAGMITLWSAQPVHTPMDFLRHVVLDDDGWLFEAWFFMGAFLAAPMFASSVVTLPLLLDTGLPMWNAVLASWRAVAANPGPMVIWAIFIAALMMACMLTWLLGLVVVVPLLAHASWHAYAETCGVPTKGMDAA